MMHSTDDLRISSLRPLLSPALLLEELPISKKIVNLVEKSRQSVADIISGVDDRLLVIIGPCSIHDPKAAIEYGEKLTPYIDSLKKDLCIVMRVYFEKPRTTVGWKGPINDPDLNNSFAINKGLRCARKLLLELASKGIPSGTEFLDTIIPQFIADVICWGAIGARTTESQIHRELASGLSMPVGFKNGTTGNVQIAVDAVGAASQPHYFVGMTKHGIPAVVGTTGNKDCHIILRGSSTKTNYDKKSVEAAAKKLENAKISPSIMVDCSHGNSRKDYKKQSEVLHALNQQIQDGSQYITGVMIESHLVEGKQALQAGKELIYGQSVTDGCIGFDESISLLKDLVKAVQKRRNR